MDKIIRKVTKRRKSRNWENEDERNWEVIICGDYFIWRVTNPSALSRYLFDSTETFFVEKEEHGIVFQDGCTDLFCYPNTDKSEAYGIKEYFMLLLLGIALWFLVVVPTWTRSSRMSLHCWEGSNSITLLLPAQVLLPASAADLLPSFYTCWGRWISLWWERELTGVWGYSVWQHLTSQKQENRPCFRLGSK